MLAKLSAVERMLMALLIGNGCNALIGDKSIISLNELKFPIGKWSGGRKDMLYL